MALLSYEVNLISCWLSVGGGRKQLHIRRGTHKRENMIIHWVPSQRLPQQPAPPKDAYARSRA
jgi:hypothetical protein